MTKSFNKKQIGLAVACALALGILSGALRARKMPVRKLPKIGHTSTIPATPSSRAASACAGTAALARPRRLAPNATPITSLMLRHRW